MSVSLARVAGFDAVERLTEQRLKTHAAQRLPIPPDFTERTINRDSGAISLRLRCFLTQHAEVRLVRLASPKIDVFSCFAYPNCERNAPLYAMEFVLLGGKPVIAVIDYLTLTHDANLNAQLDREMQSMRNTLRLANDSDVPDWYAQCRSGRDIFVRPSAQEGQEVFATLSDIHQVVLEHCLVATAAAHRLPDSQRAAHDAQICAYKRHHSANSPGRPIMQKTFGDAWTEQFMNDWVFC